MTHSREGAASLHVRLRVHHLRTLRPTGESSDNPFVFCPRHRRTMTLESCLECPRLLAAAEDSIDCTAVPDEDLADEAFDIRLGGDVCVGDVMGCSTVCVLAEVTGAALARSLKEMGNAFAVVVDGPDRFLGLVDLEAATLAGDKLSAGRLARHVQPVREAAPLAFAVERMVHERARALPVVDEEGFVVALISDIDALRWVANRARKT
jgi:CBS domain-containing protein